MTDADQPRTPKDKEEPRALDLSDLSDVFRKLFLGEFPTESDSCKDEKDA